MVNRLDYKNLSKNSGIFMRFAQIILRDTGAQPILERVGQNRYNQEGNDGC
jgi:hypothetical protein